MRSIPPFPGVASACRVRRFVVAALLALSAAAALPAVAQQADLVINMSDAPDPGPAGGTFTYTVRIDNNGPSAASAVTLTNILPAGAIFVSVAQTQGSCAQAAGVVLCALGALPFSVEATVTIVVKLPVAGIYTNTATAISPEPDPNPSNNINVTEVTTAQIAADMSIVAVDAPDPVSAGQPYQYTVTATNNGPNALGPSDTQAITFNVPAGACITAVPSGAGWSCVPSTGYPQCSTATVITCTRTASLAVGASAPALVVNAVANQTGAVTESFFVSSSLPDGDPTNNTDTPSTTVIGGSDVSITKTAAPATVAVGSNVTYTLTPRLNGGEQPGSSGSGIITVTDTLGSNLTFVSAGGSGWTCTFTGPVTTTCTRPGPYTGGNFTNMPPITLIATATTTGTLSNTSTITIPETDPVPANNTASINVSASNDADLSLGKTASLNPVVPNVPFNYTLRVRNNGPLAVTVANTITVSEPLPAGITLTATPSGSGWTCTPNSGFPLAAPVTVTCTRPGPLAVNTNAPDITVPVVTTTTGTVVNTACVALSGPGPVDSNPANDCSSVSVSSTVLAADLQVTSKTANPDPVLAGQPLTYVISVVNNGPDVATNVVVTDTLASLLNVGGLQSAVPSQGACLPAGPVNGTSQNLSCNLGVLGVGATATVTVVILPSIALSGPRTNTARITSLDVGDPNPNNNSASVTSQVTAVADATVQKSATPSPVQAGTPLTFVITARNNGPSTAQTVVATDTLPGNAVLVQLPVVTGGGACIAPPLGSTGGTVTCTWGAITSGSQFTATYVVRPLTSAAGGTVANSVVVTTTTLESNAGNNSASTSTPVTPAQIDMLVNKTDSIDPVVLGQSTVYTITVTNAGPSFANNVTLVDTFPLGGTPTATFSYQGALTISPPGIGTCVEPPIGATSGTLSCAFPGLNSGQSAIVTYAMRSETIASGVSGTTYNTAVVSADEPETQPANNSTTQSTSTRKTADLAIVKSAPASATPGMSFNYTLVVTNNGPNPSVGAVVTDTLPAGLVYQSAGPGCVFATPVVTCTLGTLAVSATTTITIGVRASSPFTGTAPIVNTAHVATVNEVDPVVPNNTSTATTTLGSSLADLAIVKTGLAIASPGAQFDYSLVVTNNGPSASVGAVVTDPLPPGVTYVSASAGCSYGAGIVTCIAGTLSSGASVVFTVTVRVDSPFTATNPITNVATVAAVNEVDSNPSNNTSTAVTRIVPQVPVPTISGPLLVLLSLLLTGVAWGALRRR